MKTSTFKNLIIACTVVFMLGFILNSPAQNNASKLNGKSYSTKMTDPVTGKISDEEISFKDNALSARILSDNGFENARFMEKDGGNMVAFTGEAFSEKNGNMHIDGMVKDGKVTASVVWEKPGQLPAKFVIGDSVQPTKGK